MSGIDYEVCSKLQLVLGSDVAFGYDSDACFEILSQRYPTTGSKIDWRQVPGARLGSVRDKSPTTFRREALRFVQSVLHEEEISPLDDVAVIGDSAMDLVVRVQTDRLAVALGVIIDLPQHTYVLRSDGGWCIAITMEGDLCFGFAPTRTAK